MRLFRRTRRTGFTLVELAIVVGVTGLLFSGLWRLMSSGNSQLREQSAADQMSQLVNATRGFLASQQGQGLLTAMNALAVQRLTLPPAANPAGSAGCVAAVNAGLANTGTYCNFLPAGFSAATVNSYNEPYQVESRKRDGAAAVAPQSYDFLITTTGGDVITDTAGGRISAGIGANGGFIYTANVCGAPNTFACGAFGSFQFDVTAASPAGFGIATPGSGRLAVLTTSASGNNANTLWLARVTVPGDTLSSLGPNTFNTMRADLNIGDSIIAANLHMRPIGGAGGQLNMNNGILNLNTGVAPGAAPFGTLNLDGGTIQGAGFINISNTAPSVTPLILNTNTGGGAGTAAASARLTGDDCDITAGGGCIATLNVVGSVQVQKGLSILETGKAVTFEAVTFIYTSDMRAKQNIVPLTGALDKISRLQGYHFQWNDNGRDDLGVMAQDVQKVFPELVHQSGDGKLGVEYGNLIAPVIEAIKELKQENTDLRRRIDAQQQTIDRLQKGKKI